MRLNTALLDTRRQVAMAGLTLHKGSRIHPAARAPQDPIKLALVPVFPATKELWATEPQPPGPCHLAAACVQRDHIVPSHCAGGRRPARWAPHSLLRRCPPRGSPSAAPEYKEPAEEAAEGPGSEPRDHTGPVRAFHSSTGSRSLSGSGLRHHLQAAMWGGREGGGTKALSHLERDEPSRPDGFISPLLPTLVQFSTGRTSPETFPALGEPGGSCWGTAAFQSPVWRQGLRSQGARCPRPERGRC